jgi:hypothetical protein
MPQILVTILNDDGTQTQKSFNLDGNLDCLDSIDEAVENFKNVALPQVEQHLLQKAQERTLAKEKKNSHLARNGTDTVRIQTRHGQFSHQRVRLRDEKGNSIDILTQTFSAPLRNCCLFWSIHLPFSQVEQMLQQQCGIRLVSEDSLWRICQNESLKLDEEQRQIISQSVDLPEPCYQAASDIYDPDAPESVVYTDGIGVKAQKPTREKVGEAKVAKGEKRHETDVMILPRPDRKVFRHGGEHFICEGVSSECSLVESARAYLK